MTWLERIRPISGFFRFIAVSLALTMAVRFSIVAFRAGGPPEAPAASASGGPSASPLASSAGFASTAPPGKPVRTRLSISAGPDRATLFVDGSRLGQIPYVGETSCRMGEKVIVEIVPQKGEKLRFERVCSGGTIRVP